MERLVEEFRGVGRSGRPRTTTIPLRRLVMFDVERQAASDLQEVIEAAAREVQELAPLVLLGMRGAARLVHELEHQGSARADVGAPRNEIAADERLNDAGLAAALAPHEYGVVQGSGVDGHARAFCRTGDQRARSGCRGRELGVKDGQLDGRDVLRDLVEVGADAAEVARLVVERGDGDGVGVELGGDEPLLVEDGTTVETVVALLRIDDVRGHVSSVHNRVLLVDEVEEWFLVDDGTVVRVVA
jgi:hypothetical protein